MTIDDYFRIKHSLVVEEAASWTVQVIQAGKWRDVRSFSGEMAGELATNLLLKLQNAALQFAVNVMDSA